MALFDIKPEQEPKHTKPQLALDATATRALQQFEKEFPELEQGMSYVLPSYVQFSSHELLTHIASKIGACSLWLTSYAISTSPIQQLVRLRELGQILSTHLLLDARVKIECPKAYQFASVALGNVHLTSIHAKVFVLQNDDWAVTVVASANLTHKRRIEAYSIHTCKNVAQNTIKWIEEKSYESTK